MTCTLFDSPATKVLADLYADAERQRLGSQDRRRTPKTMHENPTPFERFSELKHLYMPIDRPFGHLMYSLIRASRPLTIIEFGTSFGISTIYLAAAARDNGVGKIVTTEFIAEKAEIAKKNLSNAGLVDLIDFRIGDAIQTLKQTLEGPVDFLFLDGDKSMYLDILRLLEPQMKPGCLIVSDNTDHDGAKSLLDYVRNVRNGYVSTPLLTPGGAKNHSGHEASVRL